MHNYKSYVSSLPRLRDLVLLPPDKYVHIALDTVSLHTFYQLERIKTAYQSINLSPFQAPPTITIMVENLHMVFLGLAETVTGRK